MEPTNAKNWVNKIDNGDIDEILKDLYVDTDDNRERLKKLLTKHAAKCPDAQIRIFSSPGRTEICGNHTDHNHGKVIAASVDFDILAVVSTREDFNVNIYTDKLHMNIENLEKEPDETNSSEALIRGIARYLFEKKSINPKGFDCTLNSRVPRGSGLSSSAAFEILISRIFSSLYLENTRSKLELALCSKKAENIYFGKPSGLMDQLSSSWGGAVVIDFRNPEDPLIRPIKLDFSTINHQLMIIKTKGDHTDLTELYSELNYGMKDIASFFKKEVLREIPEKEFYQAVPELIKHKNHQNILKAMHFYSENQRLEGLTEAIDNNNVSSILQLLNQSGISSYEMLQNVLIPGGDHQELALSIQLAKIVMAGQGAVRVHGGGFAGTILVLVPDMAAKNFKTRLEYFLGENTVLPLRIRQYGSVEFSINNELIEAP